MGEACVSPAADAYGVSRGRDGMTLNSNPKSLGGRPSVAGRRRLPASGEPWERRNDFEFKPKVAGGTVCLAGRRRLL